MFQSLENSFKIGPLENHGSVKSMYDKLVNGYKVSCVGINCTNEDDANTNEYINKFNIEGYPTIKMLKDNKVIDFESRITTSSLNSFLDTMMN